MTFDDRTRSASGIFEDARAFRIGSEVAVLISDVRAKLPVAAKHTLVMPEQPVPLVSTILSLAEGGQRVLWAMRPGAEASRGQIYIESDFVQTILLRPVGELPPLDVEDLFAALTPEGCVKFLNNLLTVWRSAFRLSRDPFFIGLVEDALQALTSRPAPAKIACPIAQGRYLIETAISPDFGEISAIYALGANAILPLASPALIGAQREHNLRPCHFIVESPPIPPVFRACRQKGRCRARTLLRQSSLRQPPGLVGGTGRYAGASRIRRPLALDDTRGWTCDSRRPPATDTAPGKADRQVPNVSFSGGGPRIDAFRRSACRGVDP